MRWALLGMLLGSISTVAAAEPGGYPTIQPGAFGINRLDSQCPRAVRLVYSRYTTLAVGSSRASLTSVGPHSFRIEAGEPFCLAFLEPNGRVKDMLMEGGSGGNGYRIDATPEATLVVTEELRVPDNPVNHLPFSERTLRCADHGCSSAREQCVLKLPKNVQPRVVSDPTRAWGRRPENLKAFTILLDRLVLRALSGDAQARRLLVDDRPTDLNGAFSDVYVHAVETFQRIEELCHLRPS